ncbi:MAG: hypothetical protein JNK72_19745 [Myxococcales bacterium]|nr:hypothetical protein [Myxococcales bacterium]
MTRTELSRNSVWLACVLGASAASAQSGREDLARRDLIAQAEAARDRGEHAQALQLAQQAAAIRQHPSLRVMLAAEHRAVGHLVEALAEARACVREAEIDRQLRNRDRILASCRGTVTELEPRIARLQLQVEGTLPEGATVRVGEDEVRASLVNAPIAVSPGEIRVRVEAPGFEPIDQRAQAVSGQSLAMTLRLVAVRAPEPPPAPVAAPVTPAQAPAPAPMATPTSPVVSTSSHGPGAAPWVLVGAGGALAIGGAVMLGLSSSAETEGQNGCDDTGVCTPDAEAALDRADTYNTLAIVGFAAGGAAVIGGLVWAALAPRGGAHATRWQLGPGPSRAQGMGLSVHF